ncbi:hypothetical protein [Dactylosporangium cerinum]
MTFSPDGQTIATISDNDTAGLWDIGPLAAISTDPVREACRIIGRGLNEDEWQAYVPDVPYQPTCT